MKKLFNTRIKIFVLSYIFLLAFSPNSHSADNWDFELAPYIWLVSLQGDVTVKGQTSEVDASFSDFLEDLVFAAEIHFEATRKKGRKFGFWLDGTYVKLRSDANIGPLNLEVENQFVILEGAFFLNIHNWELGSNSANGELSKPYISLDASAGLRYWYLDAELDFKGQGPIGVSGNLDGDQDWIEPFIGLRSFININDRIRVILRTDFGGFGIGSSSDLTWVGGLGFGYAITKRIEALIGYRAIYLDYENGSGNNRFAMDVWMHNPFIGINFHL